MSGFLERVANLSPKRLALLALELHEQVERLKQHRREPIAVIGIGCRFPGRADSAEALWELLRSGCDAIVAAPTDRWNLQRPIDSLRDASGQPALPQGGFIEHVDMFDPLFFGISPREAESLDPQQRILLEVAWEALENAGLSADGIQGTRTGVFLGISGNDFAQRLLGQDASKLDGYVASGSSHAVAAGRLAYALNLSGPCLSIDTACSSSLVAVSAACDSLRLGQSNLALAGGVSLILSPETTLILAKAGMLSPDYRCKSFDEAANGFVRGEGCGLVVLKRLKDAERDRDRIMAVIRGASVNQDGRGSGLTAPNGLAQQALLRDALADAGLTPEQVQFVEGHGTGTSLGDPIEAQALAAVFGGGRSASQPLLVGSIKANLGHLEAAAGIAGLIKLVLAIEHGEIPPLLHLKTPNPHVDWASIPLSLPTRLTPWPGEPAARAGGVSSFGFSGTNAHLLLTAAPEPVRAPQPIDRSQHLLCLSAKSEGTLRTLGNRYVDFFAEHPDANLADIAFTANCGRAHHEHRLAVVGSTNEEIRERLAKLSAATPAETRADLGERLQPPGIVFQFTGQGSQYAGMAHELYNTQPSFRATIDQCDQLLGGEWETRLVDLLFSGQAAQAALLHHTAFTQPALFAIEFALAELLRSWGIQPSAVIGHSVGEYVAACVAGVFSLEDGLRLIATRARLMQSLPPGGGMVAVLARESEVARAVAPFSKSLLIAAFNGPANAVVSGPVTDLDRFVLQLENQGLPFERLTVSHAFHSSLLDPILDELEQAAAQVSYAQPRLTVISNLTGHVATPSELRSAAYWRSHARNPVRFGAGIQALRRMGYKTFVEIGPSPILSGMARRVATEPDCLWLPVLRRGKGDWEQLLETIGALYTSGVNPDWAAFDRDYSRRKLPLPTYPFERSRYWPVLDSRNRNDPSSALYEAAAYRDWLYELEWHEEETIAADREPPSYLPSPGELRDLASLEAGTLEGQIDFGEDSGYREIDRLCRDFILEALASLGLVLNPGDRFSTNALRRRLGVVDRHERLFARLLDILAEDGILRREGGEWSVVQTPSAEPAELELQPLLERYPSLAAELAVLGPCGRNLAAVLSGRTDPMQVLFPGGSLEPVARLYSEPRPVAFFNRLIARCLGEVVQRLPQHRTLRVLEIGAGTGATTASVLPLLPAAQTRYVFTDVSPQFLERARQRFKDYPFVEYVKFDLEEPAAEQGLNAQTFDVIIAANVVHVTSVLRRSMEQITQLLKPEGLLVLLEVVRPQRFGDLTVGLTQGWWSFTDTEIRPNYALISQERWIELLAEAGFIDCLSALGTRANSRIFSDQSLLLARKPSVAPSLLTRRAPGRWLLWIDRQGTGRRLAELLRERGEECVIAGRGSRFESIGNGEFLVDPNSPADHAQLIQRFRESDSAECRGAVYLWGLDSSIDEESGLSAVRAAVEDSCRGALLAVQAIVRADGLGDGSLSFITRGGVSAGIGGESSQPAQAALWGLGAGVAAEHPELHSRRIDLDPGAGDGSLALVRELLQQDPGTNPIALRGNARRSLRLKPSPARDLCYPTYRLRNNASYLVTGGLTGLGLETAGWLVAHGATRLLLVGRRPPGVKAMASIATWRGSGVEVVTLEADIGDAAGADRVLAEADRREAPLRGVIHSAGALDDATFLQQDWTRFERVFKAKIEGAWNLHSGTRTKELDFFVLYSSGASLFGSPGQANHAAANAFLDGLAVYRKSHQLPALSINWGAWREVGAAAHDNVLQRLEQQGVLAIDTRNGLKSLECLLAAGSVRAAVLPIDWTRFSAAGYEGTAGLFAVSQAEQIREARLEGTVTSTAAWRNQLQTAPRNRRRGILQDLVTREAARILGLHSSEMIDPRRPLQEFGLDSLMAVQFRNTLSTWIGIELPPTLLYSYPDVDQLVDRLAECLSDEILDSSGAESLNSGKVDLDAMTEDELAKRLEQQIRMG